NVEKDFTDDKKGTYTVKINRKKYVAYTQKDIDSYAFWTYASFCLQEIANDLLVAAGKKERLYLLYPGENYSIAVVLTPEELDLLTSWGKEVPYSEQRALEEFGRTSRK
ncbi:hypothetical protein KDA14_00940, partial [Candidatus Saccharibacteria bacterium]|nr:hypothetical protein [Candidatus Saccharibacteria bacterium]